MPGAGLLANDAAFPESPNGFQPEEDDENENRPQVATIDLTVPLSEAERNMLGRHLAAEIDRYLQETLPRRGNAEQWRRDYEIFPTGRSTRWKGSADLCSPLTHIYCSNHYIRLNQQIVKPDPPFSVIANRAEVQPYAPAIEEALWACLQEARWEEIADQVHSELPVVGNCLLRVTYEQKWVRSPRFHYEDWDPDHYEAVINTGGSQLDALFGAIGTDEYGLPKIGLHWEDQLQHSGVVFKVVPFEDMIILPASCRDPEEAFGIGERLMIRGQELALGAKNGRYFPEAVSEILSKHSEPQPWDRSDRLSVQGITPDVAGPALGGGTDATDPLYKEYLCYELCWQMDTDDDGQLEWVIVTLHAASQKILRLQFLPYEHGRPYYCMFRYQCRARELFGMSVAEKLASMQDAATAILNQIIDHADLMLNLHGNFFYDGTSGFDPDKNPIQLGRPIRVDTNVDGIKMIDVGALPAEHYQAYQLIKDQADLVTASSNPSLGKTTDASKTLGEVQIVASASNMNFEEVAANVARTWAKVWDQARWLNAQFGDNGEVRYRVTATPSHRIVAGGGEQPVPPGGVQFGAIPAELLMADVDLVPAGLKTMADVQSRIQQATILQNTLMIHPLTAQNTEALKIGLDYFMQAIMAPPRERIMASVEQWLQQQALQAQMQAEMAAATGALGGMMPPQGQGALPPGQAPAQQGPRGNPAQVPQAPQAPQPPRPPMEGATAQVVQGQ